MPQRHVKAPQEGLRAWETSRPWVHTAVPPDAQRTGSTARPMN